MSKDLLAAEFDVIVDEFLEVSSKLKLEADAMPMSLLADASFHQMKGNAEAVAVLGGVIGQEIIKIASRNDKPFNNFFSYNAVDCVANVVPL